MTQQFHSNEIEQTGHISIISFGKRTYVQWFMTVCMYQIGTHTKLTDAKTI